MQLDSPAQPLVVTAALLGLDPRPAPDLADPRRRRRLIDALVTQVQAEAFVDVEHEAGWDIPDLWRGVRQGGQKVPHGYYNPELMLHSLTPRGGDIGVCGTCMDARGITDVKLAAGFHRSTMDELTDWTQHDDSVDSTTGTSDDEDHHDAILGRCASLDLPG